MSALLASRQIEAGRDLEAVELALFEMLEEALGRRCQQTLRTRLGDGADERMLASFGIERTLPDGFYSWGGHLLYVECFLKYRGNSASLSMEEMRGMVALDRARTKFAASHPPCSGCGVARMDASGPCVFCGKAD